MSDIKQFCVSCMQYREEKYFTKWLEDKSKVRRCDICRDKEHKKKMAIDSARERRAKIAQAKQRQTRLDEEPNSRSKREVRARLYELQEKRRLARELEL